MSILRKDLFLLVGMLFSLAFQVMATPAQGAEKQMNCNEDPICNFPNNRECKSIMDEIHKRVNPIFGKAVEEELSSLSPKIHETVISRNFTGTCCCCTENTTVEVFTTGSDLLTNRTKCISRSSTPIKSIKKLCGNVTCTVKGIILLLKNLEVNTSHLTKLSRLAPSDIVVLDYFVNGTPVAKLEGNETVSLYFPKKVAKFKMDHVHCAFLDDSSKWNTTRMGVVTNELIQDPVECRSDHLSSFTMVMLKAKVSADNEFALNLISYIGYGLSLACLLFTCVVYIVLYKDLKILTTTRHLVHLNLQIALALTQITFLVGRVAGSNQRVCMAVAILLHYFSLTGFMWILLESAMLYLKLISVYGGELVKMKNFLIFGWGLPMLLVALSAGLKIDAYDNVQWCWLSYKDGFVWVFLAPIIFITSVSTVTVIAVARILFVVSKSEDADAKKRIISTARGVVILFPTLGLSWGFGVAAIQHDVLVWKYLFAIFTSLQGFFIFFIYGVFNTEIRIAVVRRFGNDVPSATSIT